MENESKLMIHQNLYCESVLSDLTGSKFIKDWLIENEPIFESITITPKGLPSIIHFNHCGEVYEGIRDFGRLYMLLKDLQTRVK